MYKHREIVPQRETIRIAKTATESLKVVSNGFDKMQLFSFWYSNRQNANYMHDVITLSHCVREKERLLVQWCNGAGASVGAGILYKFCTDNIY